jgi:hypothetical protein
MADVVSTAAEKRSGIRGLVRTSPREEADLFDETLAHKSPLKSSMVTPKMDEKILDHTEEVAEKLLCQ